MVQYLLEVNWFNIFFFILYKCLSARMNAGTKKKHLNGVIFLNGVSYLNAIDSLL